MQYVPHWLDDQFHHICVPLSQSRSLDSHWSLLVHWFDIAGWHIPEYVWQTIPSYDFLIPWPVIQVSSCVAWFQTPFTHELTHHSSKTCSPTSSCVSWLSQLWVHLAMPLSDGEQWISWNEEECSLSGNKLVEFRWVYLSTICLTMVFHDLFTSDWLFEEIW